MTPIITELVLFFFSVGKFHIIKRAKHCNLHFDYCSYVYGLILVN